MNEFVYLSRGHAVAISIMNMLVHRSTRSFSIEHVMPIDKSATFSFLYNMQWLLIDE